MQVSPAYYHPFNAHHFTVGDASVKLPSSKSPPMNAELAEFLSGAVISAVSWVPQLLFTYGMVPISGDGNWKKFSGYVLSGGLFAALGAYAIQTFHVLSKGAFDSSTTLGTTADYSLPNWKETLRFFAGGATASVITLVIDVLLADKQTGIRPAITPLVIYGEDLKETYHKSRQKKRRAKKKKPNSKK